MGPPASRKGPPAIASRPDRLRRWLALAGLPVLLHASGAWADPAALTVLLRDADGGTPCGARLQLSGPSGALFAEVDTTLHTRRFEGIGPYLYAEDSITLPVEPGPVAVLARRGLAGPPSVLELTVASDTTVTILVSRGLDPRLYGWYGGDPHVHASHPNDETQTPPPYEGLSLEGVASVARAEDLDVVCLLANDPEHPGGVAWADPFTLIQYGEEYRSGFWGHLALIGLSELLLVDGATGCCGTEGTAWPTLRATLEPHDIPLVLLAHPHPTDELNLHHLWPGSGIARELYALVFESVLHGMAVGSMSNGSDRWDLVEYLDALRMGAHWAAVGEGDVALDRWWMPPLGGMRTYARLPGLPTQDATLLAEAWTAAVRAGRCYATTGPLLLDFRVEGAEMGATVPVGAGRRVQVDLRFHALEPVTDLRLHGATGLHWSRSWPEGRADLDTTLSLEVEHDDFILPELVAEGSMSPVGDAPRAIGSPVWVEAGPAWIPPSETPRRAIPLLEYFFWRSWKDRGYESEEDSLAVWSYLNAAALLYEQAVDDPPAPFELCYPAEGDTLPSTTAHLVWHRSLGYDGEPVSYRVGLGRAPDLSDASWRDCGADTLHRWADLEPGERYYWAVQAEEPGEDPRLSEDAPWSFRIREEAVGLTPPLSVHSFRLGPLRWEGDEAVVRLELDAPHLVRIDWYDARGRRVRAGERGRREAGEYRLRWDGRDGRGHRVARGVYWMVVEVGGERVTRTLSLLR